MTEETEPIRLALTGQLPFVVIAGSITALLISLVTLKFYRRSVLHTMNRRVGENESLPTQAIEQTICRTKDVGELSLSLSDASADTTRSDYPLFKLAHQTLRRNALIYTLAGIVFTLILTLAILWSSGMGFLPLRFIMVFWVYGWPVALTLLFVAATQRHHIMLLSGGYFVILILLSVWALARSTDLTIVQIMQLWIITNLPPTLLMYAFLARPIRAVGPLVLVLVLAALTGAVLALTVAGENEPLLRFIAKLAFTVGLGASGTFVAILVMGCLLFAVLGWFALKWIRNGYLNKQLNDQSINLDAMWLLFAVFASIGLAFEGNLWALSALVAFFSYKVVLTIGFRVVKPSKQNATTNVPLLLLRVFSLGKRSEKLFDPVTKLWRHVGNVNLIAGPDLATTTVEPHEFLSFVSGRITRLFISGTAEMEQRMSETDSAADFDGRYRIHDFFCYADTWQPVLTKLVKSSRAVLMDLRGFSPQNAGCVHEIRELVNVVPLQQVVLVIDHSSDYAFLEETLKEAWRNVCKDSPNIGLSSTVKIIRLPRLSDKSISYLLGQLVAAATQK
jgi:hypothetical protein